MPHPHESDAIRSAGDKLSAMTGNRGKHPIDRASEIAGVKVTASAQGDAAQKPEEVWTSAPPRQISNYGNIKE
jgi:hypothetical protein